MNFVHMPELDWLLGYPFALGLMATAVVLAVTWFRATAGSDRGHGRCNGWAMTIQPPPPDDEMPPPMPDTDPTPAPPTPIDTPQEPDQQRAPGANEPPMGAPRDEPDPEL